MMKWCNPAVDLLYEESGNDLDAIEKMGVELAGTIPADPQVNELDAWGRPIIELGQDSPAAASIWQIAGRYIG